MDTKSRSYNILKIKRWNIQLVMHFALLLIFFFMAQVGAVLIGFTYLEGQLGLQFLVLAVSNFIFYKTMRAMNLL
ncbi:MULTISPECIES: hypothetical protein [Paraclostridium]|uniref:CPBP family intramembrane metalloprotease n=1 Tax=Paraclostridium bifermentans TaxID=1490 RepID=A0A5P3XC83_PARBF|nr:MULTISPECIES: hypothetical protein [Paraclostridium]KGJ50770.1 hypothetical protein KD33_01940 [Clostridium sp. NCR]MDU7904148.1 hypothetical protein [Peptostreptococcaceae bacterium]MDV8110351.1 hypothetical protein [Bacillus sp. BAU-SS-2023]RDC48718.1 hypothetical protein DVA85_27495 [Acinetobacter sp. RIT592]EQK45377.1 putative membrane protein [[Clostridium] bifermentans ATCC 19299] [Paraclostridium bifermentans ATCC 19299]